MKDDRNYPYSDADMLTTSRMIAESLKTNLPELSIARTNWTEEYTNDLIARIEKIMQDYLGISSKITLEQASINLTAIQTAARKDVTFFKTQIDQDFKDDKTRRDMILKILGFTTYLKKIQKDDQEAMIRLLYAFRANMTEELRQEVTANGMNPVLIDNITGYADSFSQSNFSQESLKETTKEITQESIDVFNAIYNEIIAICKIASYYYQHEPLKKEQFTFSKIVRNLHATRKAVTAEA